MSYRAPSEIERHGEDLGAGPIEYDRKWTTPEATIYGFELMEFEPVVLHWPCRGARYDWLSYVVLPQTEPRR